ncbi:putative O-glycosylation ligase, exosortase A system-associated [Magnetofaba australis]|uniref:Putative O-antigen polymerase n=1 Tax=Magnetofaba australis IT-1 TaxID=1434232 RepID=A0A1Y2K803_9PROT|nr:putative O-glycosylation ligase, exosortase A system-associated [Magnetofaba australis]OSM06863.1 putative O-antigen polymerase [Magnetofaba australis IT-1]
MRDLFLVMFVVGMLPACFLRPQVGLIMWAWIGYMNPHRLTWSYAYDFRFNYIIAIATLAGIILNKSVRVRIPWNAVTFFWVFFIFWTFVTMQTAFQPNGAYWEFIRFIKIQLMVLVTYVAISERKWIDRLIAVIFFSVAMWAVKGGIFSLMNGGAYRVYGPAKSFIEDNNALALALIMVLPLGRYLQINAKHWYTKVFMLAMMLICALTIVSTYSRGGLLGGLALVFVFWMRGRRRILTAMLIVPVLYGLYNFMPQHWHDRMHSISTFTDEQAIEQDYSVDGRINSWKFAVNLALDRPFMGGGFDTFTYAAFKLYAPSTWVHDAHSIYFEVLAEHGVFGFLLFFFFHFFAFLQGNWVIRHTKQHEDLTWAHDLVGMIQASMAGYYVAGAFLGLAYFDLPYHLISIVVIIRIYVRKVLQARGDLIIDNRGDPLTYRRPAGKASIFQPDNRSLGATA